MCDLNEVERVSERARLPLSQTCLNLHPPPHGSKQHKCHVRVRWRCLRGWLSLVTHSPHRWPQGRDEESAGGRQGGTLNKNFVCCNAVKATFCYPASQSHTMRGWRTSTISHLNEVDLRVRTCFLQILRLLSIQIPWKCSALLLSFLHPGFSCHCTRKMRSFRGNIGPRLSGFDRWTFTSIIILDWWDFLHHLADSGLAERNVETVIAENKTGSSLCWTQTHCNDSQCGHFFENVGGGAQMVQNKCS